MNSTLKYTALAVVLSVATASQAETPSHGAAAPAPAAHGAAPATDAHGKPIAAATLPQGQPAAAGHGPAWAYEGPNGPDVWAQISADFATCGTGMTQSPIDIAASDGSSTQPIEFDYNITPMTILNNGHTVQVNYEAGSGVTIGGKRFELLQFHFHTPSEHAIEGSRAAMEAHFVHKAADGELAVIGVMLQGGQSNLALEEIWQFMPMQAGGAQPVAQVLLNARDLLPKHTEYFRYMGSLTTPPCTEGVNWYVMDQPISVGAEQVAKFASAIGNNARPLQALHSRLILAPTAAN